MHANRLIEGNAIALAAGRVSDPATIAKQCGIDVGSHGVIAFEQERRE